MNHHNMKGQSPLRPLRKPPAANPNDLEASKELLFQHVIDQANDIYDLKAEIEAERKKGDELEYKIDELLQFLDDYGLKWVGGAPPKDETFSNGPDDMNKFIAQINTLNAMADKNSAYLKKEKNIARVEHKKPILLSLYNDHFTLNNGPDRMYTHPTSVQFFKDIYDGFYPSEFKSDHPDGVQFRVEDHRKPDLFIGKERHLNSQNIDKNVTKNSRKMQPNENGEYGEGDGSISLRIPPPVGNKVLLTNSKMKMREIRRFVASTFDINDFEICDSITGKPYDDDALLEMHHLYPKGIVSVIVQTK